MQLCMITHRERGKNAMEHTLYRETWAEVDLSAIAHNVAQVRRSLPNKTELVAVVKANGYGHGSVEVAKIALQSGASSLAVALLEEALALRAGGVTAPILVLGRVAAKDAHVAVAEDIALTFFQSDWLEEVNRQTFQKRLQVHMKWDSGFGRLGVRSNEEMQRLIDGLEESKNVELAGVYTHFATADEADTTHYELQTERFLQLKKYFEARWDKSIKFHTGNSAATLRFPNQMQDMSRLGVAMYGLYPSEATEHDTEISLKPAFSLHSTLVHVKKVAKGETIGYGCTYRCEEKEEWIGTFPIGYADGWTRKLQGMEVLVDGKRFPIVGRICMDQTMVHLDKEYPVGTKLTLIGKQNDERITMEEVANYIDTINYEIPCMITERVPRIYINRPK